MYIIEIDNQWIAGELKGWLSTTASQSMATVYQTLLDAQEAVEFYTKLAPQAVFKIHCLDQAV